MSNITGAEAMPEITSKEYRNFDWPIYNTCTLPYIIINSKIDRHKYVYSWPEEQYSHRLVRVPCSSLAEPLREPIVVYLILVICVSIFLTLL
jgi:hypothetical protein